MKKFVVFFAIALPMFLLVSCKEKVDKKIYDQSLRTNDSLRVELNSRQAQIDSLMIQAKDLSEKLAKANAPKPKADKKKAASKKKGKK
jgi:hypothetical protein